MAQNFENAFLRTQPSVSAKDRAFYISMKDRLCKARAHPSEAPPPGADTDHTAPPTSASKSGRDGDGCIESTGK